MRFRFNSSGNGPLGAVLALSACLSACGQADSASQADADVAEQGSFVDALFDAGRFADSAQTFASLSGALAPGELPLCCEPSSTGGCEQPDCESCVCAQDAYCCAGGWDSVCVGVATSTCQAECGCVDSCAPPIGDLNGDGAVTVPDVQCGILTVLAALNGGEPPTCLVGGLDAGDVDCSGAPAVSDVVVVIRAALGDALPPAVDANADGCPDTCEYDADAVCGDGDGTPCDDGDRCTVGDVCAAGTCQPGPPGSCDDGDPCTIDDCLAAVGCVTQPDPECGEPGDCTGAELPDDGVDSDCDGFEYFLTSANSLQLLQPLTAESLSVEVAGSFEMGLFGEVSVTGTMQRASAGAPISWCVSGTASWSSPALPLQNVEVTVCRSAAGAITTSVSAQLAWPGGGVSATGVFDLVAPYSATIHVDSLQLTDSLRLLDIDFTLEQGELSAEVAGQLRAGAPGNSFVLDVTGSFSTSGALDLDVTQPTGNVWTPFSGIGLSLSGASGHLTRSTDGEWSADISASLASAEMSAAVQLSNLTLTAHFSSSPGFEVELDGQAIVGPFDTAIEGTLTRTADGEVMGCLTGSVASSAVAGVAVNNISLAVCVDSDGVSIALDGSMLLEGQTAQFTGEITVSGGTWTLQLDALDIQLAPGILIQELRLTIEENATQFAWLARLLVGTGPGALPLQVSGSYVASGPLELTGGITPGQSWTPLSNLPGLVINQLEASLVRLADGSWTVMVHTDGLSNLSLGAGVSLTGVALDASVNSVGAWAIQLSGSVALGAFGTISVAGTLSQQAPGQPLQACFSSVATFDQVVKGVDFAGLSFDVCVDDGAVEVTFDATMTFEGQQFTVSGQYLPGPPATIVVQFTGLQLSPGLALDPVTLEIRGSGVTLSGEVRLGTGATQLHALVSGTWVAGGDYTLSLSLLSPWTPVVGWDFTFTTATGELRREGGETTLTVSAGGGADLQLVPGFSLTDWAVVGEFGPDGVWSIRLVGTFDLQMGGTTHEVVLSAALDSDSALTFTGELAGEIVPLPNLLGDSLVIRDITVSVSVDLDDVAFEVRLGATADVCLPSFGSGGCDNATIVVEAGLLLGDQTGIWISGSLDGYELPMFGELPGLTLVASSVELSDFDVFDTPSFGGDDVDLPAGLTLVAIGPNPVPFEGVDELILRFSVSLSGTISLAATVPLNWTIIGANSDAPVNQVELRQIELVGEFTPPATFALRYESLVVFTPKPSSNPNTPPPTSECVDEPGSYCGFAVIELAAAAGLTQITCAFWLEGRIYDPFGLHPFALENPGMQIGLSIQPPAPPFPSAIGVAGTFYWLNSGETWPTWPINNSPPELEGYQPEVPLLGEEQPAGLPSNVTQIGGAVNFDLVDTEGLCFLGACAPFPSLLVYFEIRNFSFPVDVMKMIVDAVESIRDKLPGDMVPPVGFDFVPFEFFDDAADATGMGIDFERFVVSFSTSDQELFGKEYRGGLLLDILMTVNKFLDPSDPEGLQVQLAGQLDARGVFLEGKLEGFDLFGLDFLTVVGNPIAHYAKLNGGYIEVPDASRLDRTSGTIEGWVKEGSIGSGAFAATLYDKSDADNGIAIGIGNATAGQGKVSVRVRSGGQSFIVTSTEAVIEPNIWQHVAVVFGTKTGKRYVQIVVDGRALPIEATLDGADYPLYGGAKGMAFQGIPFLPGANASPVLLGTGLTAIDDVRVWSVERTMSELDGEKSFLTMGTGGQSVSTGQGGANVNTEFDTISFVDDPDLVARWEFDYDKLQTTGIANNSRLQMSGSSHHGTYKSGANPILYTGFENPTFFKLNLRIPDATLYAGPPGLWIRTGMILDLPLPDEIISDISVMAQVSLTVGQIEGIFYAPEIRLLDIPNFGQFVLGGWGPNFVPDDFDDGLFAFADLWTLEFGATGKMALEGPKGNSSVGAEFAVTFDCAPNTSCSSLFDRELWLYGLVDLAPDISQSGQQIGIVGAMELLATTQDWFIQIAGQLEFAGVQLIQILASLDQEMFSGEATIGSTDEGVAKRLTPDEELDDLDLGGIVGIGFEVHFTKPYELCLDLVVPVFGCSIGMCIGGEKGFEVPFICGNVCAGADVCPDDQGCGCIADFEGFHVGTCYDKNSKELGEVCKVDNECTTGKCSGELCFKGECVCTQDSHCGPGMWCDKGDPCLSIGKNVCKPKKDNGETCTADHKCASGECSANSCTNPCGYCFETASKQVGQDCRVDAECVTDKCGYVCGAPGFGKCKCDDDSQCGADEYCQLGLLGDNLCHPKKQDGTGCDNDRQCLSGQCGGCIDVDGVASVGWCYTPDSRDMGDSCYADNQCSSGVCGAECVLGVFFAGVCKCNANTNNGCSGADPYCWNGGTVFDGSDNECVQCTKDNHCAAGKYCSGSHNCVPDKAIGESCDDNDQCLSDNCSDPLLGDRECVCEVDGDCPGGEKCFEPIGAKAFCGECANNGDCASDEWCNAGHLCKPKRANGSNCSSDDQCLGVCSSGGICYCNAGNNNGCSGSTPYCKDNTVLDASDNECVACLNDNDCVASKYCSANNSCLNDKAIGASCDDNDQCITGNCSDPLLGNRECVCEVDTDCPTGEDCFEPIGAKAFCGECANDGDCSSSQYCNSAHNCAAKKSNGSSCGGNNECVGTCASGTCRCKASNNDGCSGSTPYCKDNNVTTATDNTCVACLNDGDCVASKYCGSSNTCLNDKAIGASCDDNDQCITGNCSDPLLGNRECVCEVDSDCPTGEDCFEPFGAKAYCGECANDGDCSSSQYCNSAHNCAAKKSNGSSCDSNSECVGTCASGTCRCKASNNDGCSGSTPYCKDNNITTATDNTCVACLNDGDCASSKYCGSSNTCLSDKALGVSCSGNGECLSGNCSDPLLGNRVCVCNVDSDCPGSDKCWKPFGQKAFCGECANNSDCGSNQYCNSADNCAAKKYEGSTCSSDSECYAECASDGRCGCNSTTNSGCPSSTLYCDGGSDPFSQADNNCVECKSNSHCGSNEYCSNNNCYTKKSMGASCSSNGQCATGQCEGGDCVCANDADCTAKYGSAYDCTKPVTLGKCGGSINFCKKSNSDYYCE